MSTVLEKWEMGRAAEISYWEDWLTGRTEKAEERAFRLSEGRPFPWWAKPLIVGDQEYVRVMDLGAGPATVLGNQWVGREVMLVPLDPLAPEFDEILSEHGITPPVRTVYGMGEKLVSQYGENSFDFIFASYAIDRSVDPLACIQQSLAVLKSGASLLMVHRANEGELNNYKGMHLWNFSVRDGRLMVWNHEQQIDVINNCEKLSRHHVERKPSEIRVTLTKA